MTVAYLYPLVFGFIASLLGFLAPSMLSMTAVRTAVERGRRAGLQFAAGAASVILIQGFIAVFFAKYLVANPEVITNLKKAAIFILIGLSLYFYLAMVTLAESNGWLVFDKTTPLIFIIGAMLGSFVIFSVYVVFADIISIKYQFIARNIN